METAIIKDVMLHKDTKSNCFSVILLLKGEGIHDVWKRLTQASSLNEFGPILDALEWGETQYEDGTQVTVENFKEKFMDAIVDTDGLVSRFIIPYAFDVQIPDDAKIVKDMLEKYQPESLLTREEQNREANKILAELKTIFGEDNGGIVADQISCEIWPKHIFFSAVTAYSPAEIASDPSIPSDINKITTVSDLIKGE